MMLKRRVIAGRSSNLSNWSEAWAGDIPRNTCYQLLDFNDNSVWNATSTRWQLFHTTTCDGAHAEIAPGYAGPLPAGYNLGQTHALMRTSTTS
jgi:hypothetical protein